MIKSPPQAILGPITALLLACLSMQAPAQERVEARLSSQSLTAGQPVELTLTATSEDTSLGSADLSVLEPDFQVLDRRVERRVSVSNGRRREEMRLRIVLMPRREGALTLPAIPFGSARSVPLNLTVEPGAAKPQYANGDKAGQTPFNLDPRVFEEPGTSGRTVPPPQWPWGLSPGAAPSFMPNSYPFAGPPWDGSAADPATASPPAPAIPQIAPAPAPEPARSASLASNPWFWVSLGLAGTLAGLLLNRRGAGRTPATAAATPHPDMETEPPDPLVEALGRVREAYRRGDGGAARDALLAWGRLRWPENPPGNLARLAGRFPPPLREHITELEKAFFSPDPIHWEREPVADALSKDWTAQSVPERPGTAAA